MIRNIFTPLLNSLLFSNVFIAVCAMAQTTLTYLLLQVPINLNVVALLGVATLFLYNLSLILSKPQDYKSSPFLRVNWFFSHFRLMIIFTALAFLATVALALNLSLSSIVLLFSISILALSYNLPVLKIENSRFGLRNIPGAKLFIISFVWACSCVWVPIVELKSQNLSITGVDTFLLVAKRFLFVMAITLPFDIRDVYQDRRFHLKTIPIFIGEKKSLILCQLLLLVYISFLLLFIENINSTAIALIAVAVFTGFLIIQSKYKKNEYFYFLFLDGTLLLQLIAVGFANNLP